MEPHRHTQCGGVKSAWWESDGTPGENEPIFFQLAFKRDEYVKRLKELNPESVSDDVEELKARVFGSEE